MSAKLLNQTWKRKHEAIVVHNQMVMHVCSRPICLSPELKDFWILFIKQG